MSVQGDTAGTIRDGLVFITRGRLMTNVSGARSSTVGRALSGLVVLALVADSAVTLIMPRMLSHEIAATGFSLHQAPMIAIIILICALLYAVPKTAVLGAILLTGFLGGAICTHFRLGELFSPPQIVCLTLGILAWGGLYLRDARVRTLLPLMS